MTDVTLQMRRRAAAGTAVLAQFSDKGCNSFGVVRLLAAIAVIVTHAFGVVGGWDAAEPLHAATGFSLGAHAVHVFFALSGFMVAASWERSSGWLDFVLARLLRVMPALIFVNVVIVVLAGLFLTTAAPADYWTLKNLGVFFGKTILLFSAGTPLQGVFADNPMPGVMNIPIWTIRFEVICYATLLALLIFMTALRLTGMMRLVPVLAVLGVTAVMLARAPAPDAFTSLDNFARFIFVFYLGVAAWIARDLLSINLRILLVLAALTALSIQIDSAARLPLMILAVAYGSFWLGSMRMGWLQRWTDKTDLSYGVYITGFFIQQWLIEALPDSSAYTNMLLATLVALLAAWLSWTFVERPALRLRKHFTCNHVPADKAILAWLR